MTYLTSHLKHCGLGRPQTGILACLRCLNGCIGIASLPANVISRSTWTDRLSALAMITLPMKPKHPFVILLTGGGGMASLRQASGITGGGRRTRVI